MSSPITNNHPPWSTKKGARLSAHSLIDSVIYLVCESQDINPRTICKYRPNNRNSNHLRHNFFTPDAFTADIPVSRAVKCIPSGLLQIGNIITDGRRNLWIDIGQCAYGVPEWDISLCWRISQIADPKMTDNLFHLTPEQMKQHWNIFAPAYYELAPQEMGSIIKRILPYAAIKSAYMYYLTFHKPIPDDMGHRLLDSMLG